MVRKCPPGVFCITNMSLLMIAIIVGVLLYAVVYRNDNANHTNTSSVTEEQKVIVIDNQSSSPFYTNPNVMLSSRNQDTYLNSYAPPLRQNPFFPNVVRGDVRGGVPINVPTSHYDMAYRQVGILTRSRGKETILALFGRPLHANRNKWKYYTMTDRSNTVKLPVNKGGRSCTGTYGCDEIYSGDTIYVDGYNDAFKATIYDNSEPRYIPYL
jgi:hypothetical protein